MRVYKQQQAHKKRHIYIYVYISMENLYKKQYQNIYKYVKTRLKQYNNNITNIKTYIKEYTKLM